MSRNATLRRATTATGMPERVRIQAPSATPPAPLAGTIEPTAISESEISNVERHDIRGQNAGRNIATYERLDSTSRRIATAIHPGEARSRIARTDPSPGASSAMSTRTTIATTTTSAATDEPARVQLVGDLVRVRRLRVMLGGRRGHPVERRPSGSSHVRSRTLPSVYGSRWRGATRA